MSSIFIFALCVHIKWCMDVSIKIGLEEPKAVVDSKFLSVTMDSSEVKKRFTDMNLESEKLLTLANGLTPHGAQPETFLRFGGTIADHVIFDPNMYVLNVTELDMLCKFVDKLGWKLVYDLNVLMRKPDGSWNPNNAIEVIDYLEKRNFSLHYELGNEPDQYPMKMNYTLHPKQLAEDFHQLRQLMNEKVGRKSMLIGPDLATLSRYNYFEYFLANITENTLSAVSFHHYYSSSRHVTVENFTNPKYLDHFLTWGLRARSILKKSFPTPTLPPLWLGETSSTYGSGSYLVGESFAAGFLWLDKLGLAAQMNISVVMRQCLKGGHYSLLRSDYEPNSDYWSSVLYKQLMGRAVLGVTGFLKYNRQVRVYAHCVNPNNGRGYNRSSLVLMFLNVHPTENANIRFIMNGWSDLIAHLFLLQPAYGGLSDKFVTLNGNLLKMVDAGTLPVLNPVLVAQPYIIPPLSYGFLVIPKSSVLACGIY